MDSFTPLSNHLSSLAKMFMFKGMIFLFQMSMDNSLDLRGLPSHFEPFIYGRVITQPCQPSPQTGVWNAVWLAVDQTTLRHFEGGNQSLETKQHIVLFSLAQVFSLHISLYFQIICFHWYRLLRGTNLLFSWKAMIRTLPSFLWFPLMTLSTLLSREYKSNILRPSLWFLEISITLH